MTTHEVLVAARNLIDRSWVGRFPSGDGEECVASALANTGGGISGEYTSAYGLLRRITGASRLSEWNDAPGRRKEEVLAAFDEAIAATAPEPADPFPSGQPLVTA